MGKNKNPMTGKFSIFDFNNNLDSGVSPIYVEGSQEVLL